MNKKIILIFIGVIFLIAIGLICWKVFGKKEIEAVSFLAPKPSPTITYPKVTTYQVPILMYHYIRNAEGESEMGKNLSVSPENFEAHVKFLKDNGYETLRVADLADPERKALSKIVYEEKKPIILTFDDGYADAYTNAFGILKKYNSTATFYIIRDYVGKAEYMSQDQINELEKAGMEIGSHTLTHPDLTKISVDDARAQITKSKENALTFCYPAGRYNQTTVQLIQEAGYLAAVTTKFGIAGESSNPFELPRVRVENTSAEVLVNKIEAAAE